MPSSEKLDHLTLKAVTTVTDQGLFEAVISAESEDREKDIVSPAGMVAALRKWNRPLPLAWAHSTKAEDIFGFIDTQSAREVAGEVVVNGQVDLESGVGKEAWRSFKQGTIGFSYGYLVLKSTKRNGGGRNITELDVFEVTATPTPMHNSTRVLNTKAVAEAEEPVDVTPDAIVSPEDLASEAWKLVTRDKPEVRVGDEPSAKLEVTNKPKALARFPDVQTEDDFKGLSFHDKLAVYYAGLDDGDTESAKSVWAHAFVTQLPDPSFFYCGRVTETNAKGTTTEDRRWFPVKDADGKVDVSHLRDALSRIPLSNLPQKAKDKLTAEARDALKKIASEPPSKAVEDGQHEEPPKAKSAPQDPLVTEAWNLIAPRSHGPHIDPTPEPEPEPLDRAQVQREAWALSLKTSGT